MKLWLFICICFVQWAVELVFVAFDRISYSPFFWKSHLIFLSDYQSRIGIFMFSFSFDAKSLHLEP